MGVALDDFGTGFSSLVYLKTFPLMCSRSTSRLCVTWETDLQDRAIVKTVIDLADNLGLRTVAEGRRNRSPGLGATPPGVHELQGYLFAKPMPASAF